MRRQRNDFNGPSLCSERLKGNFIYLIYFVWYNFSSYQNIRYLEILTVKLYNYKLHPVIYKKLSIWIQFEFNLNSVKSNVFLPELLIWIQFEFNKIIPVLFKQKSKKRKFETNLSKCDVNMHNVLFLFFTFMPK